MQVIKFVDRLVVVVGVLVDIYLLLLFVNAGVMESAGHAAILHNTCYNDCFGLQGRLFVGLFL